MVADRSMTTFATWTGAGVLAGVALLVAGCSGEPRSPVRASADVGSSMSDTGFVAPSLASPVPADGGQADGGILTGDRSADDTGGATAPASTPTPAAPTTAGPTTAGPTTAGPSTAVTPGSSAATPGTAPVDWRLTIPPDFPLAAGMIDAPKPSATGDGFGAPRVCGTTFDSEADLAARLAVAVAEHEFADVRTLAVFADADAADARMAAVRQVYAQCPEETHAGTVWINSTRDGELGEDSFVGLTRYTVDGERVLGLDQIQFVRVGNAVLMTGVGDEFATDPESLDAAVAERTRDLQSLAAAMCVFAADGC